jgi:hypothetical protein
LLRTSHDSSGLAPSIEKTMAPRFIMFAEMSDAATQVRIAGTIS